MARRRNPVLQWVLTSLGIAMLRILGALPLSWSRWMARTLAPALYYVVPRIRRVGWANLDLAYGDTLTRSEKARILKAAARNMALVIAELPHVPRIKDGLFRQYVLVKGQERLPQGRAAVLIGAHFGNWEWMAAMVARLGHQVAAVVRPFDDPRMDRVVDQLRTSSGLCTVPKDHAGSVLAEKAEAGWLIGMLADQNPRENAVPVQFFGQPCWATIGPAMLARRTNAPVHLTSIMRLPDGRYELEFHPEIPMARTQDTLADLVENTQRCQDAIEALVRRDPGQWLWPHRRWRPRPRLEQEWQDRRARVGQNPGPNP